MMLRANPEFAGEFARVSGEIKKCIAENDHTVALMWAQGFIVGVGGTKIGQADRVMLNALHDLHKAIGEMTPAMIGMRTEIMVRIRQTASRLGVTADELTALGL